jgi:hypothetical protein
MQDARADVNAYSAVLRREDRRGARHCRRYAALPHDSTAIFTRKTRAGTLAFALRIAHYTCMLIGIHNTYWCVPMVRA